MKKRIIIPVLLLITQMCIAQRDTVSYANLNAHDLAIKMAPKNFYECFWYPMHDNIISKILHEVKDIKILDTIIDGAKYDGRARLLACEVELNMTPSVEIIDPKELLSRHDGATIAAIYAEALANNYTGMANSWGFLYDEDDAGITGAILPAIGRKAVPALYKLLDNNSDMVYMGSEDATIGNGYRYRVKDAAAFYIGRIMNMKLKYYADFTDCDKQIANLEKEALRMGWDK